MNYFIFLTLYYEWNNRAPRMNVENESSSDVIGLGQYQKWEIVNTIMFRMSWFLNKYCKLFGD